MVGKTPGNIVPNLGFVAAFRPPYENGICPPNEWKLINMPNYRRADAPGACYFFTVVTYRRRQFLTDEPARRILREAIIQARQKYPFVIDAWVLLPDHLHCMWTLPEGDNDFSTCLNHV